MGIRTADDDSHYELPVHKPLEEDISDYEMKALVDPPPDPSRELNSGAKDKAISAPLAKIKIKGGMINVDKGNGPQEHGSVAAVWEQAVDKLKQTRQLAEDSVRQDQEAGKKIDAKRTKSLDRMQTEIGRAETLLTVLKDPNHPEYTKRMAAATESLRSQVKDIYARGVSRENVAEGAASARSRMTVFTTILRDILQSLMK